MSGELRQDVVALTDSVKRFTLERIAPHVSQLKDLAARQLGL
jgi:hypothetical protein